MQPAAPFTFTLTVTPDELAVLLAALSHIERSKVANTLATITARNLQTFNAARLDFDAVGVYARGLRQQITGKLCNTRPADDLDREASRIKGANLRSAVQHVLKHSRLNADQTIRDEYAASPLDWGAVFTGSAESMLSRDASPALLRWFAVRGIRP